MVLAFVAVFSRSWSHFCLPFGILLSAFALCKTFPAWRSLSSPIYCHSLGRKTFPFLSPPLQLKNRKGFRVKRLTFPSKLAACAPRDDENEDQRQGGDDPWMAYDPWEWQMEQNKTKQPWPGFDSEGRKDMYSRASFRRSFETTDAPRIIQEWERERGDENDDSEFYSAPRLVYHADHDCLARLTSLYRKLIPKNSVVLDLMSSWTSHLPTDANFSRVIGVGMNEAELQSNPQLSSFSVQDLNKDPRLQQEAGSVDAVLISAGIQYLTRPEAVLAEARRVLRRDGVVIVSFSEHSFTSKATKAFALRPPPARAELTVRLLEEAGLDNVQTHDEVREPDWLGADRLYAISGLRPDDPAQQAEAGVGEKTSFGLGLGEGSNLGVGGGGILMGGITIREESAVVWRGRLESLVAEAEAMGIPRDQLGVGGDEDGDVTVEEYRERMAEIHQIIASRLSSNL